LNCLDRLAAQVPGAREGQPDRAEIEPLRKGITIDGERFQPMEVKIDRHQGANAWLTVGLREGRNRKSAARWNISA